MGHWSDPNIKARRGHKDPEAPAPVGYTPGTGAPGPEQHGDERHEGRIEDGGNVLPGAGEDGELFYKEDSDELYIYKD